MIFDVILLKEANNGYVARPILWPDVMAQGATEQEALDQVQNLIRSQLGEARLVQIRVDVPEEKSKNPWIAKAGAFADDPTWEDFLQEINNYRGG
jgi:predicted RNase H-like HicB family nuclease